jgi:hypothetical protein
MKPGLTTKKLATMIHKGKSLDETAYLLSSPLNARRLRVATHQLESRQEKPRKDLAKLEKRKP